MIRKLGFAQNAAIFITNRMQRFCQYKVKILYLNLNIRVGRTQHCPNDKRLIQHEALHEAVNNGAPRSKCRKSETNRLDSYRRLTLLSNELPKQDVPIGFVSHCFQRAHCQQ